MVIVVHALMLEPYAGCDLAAVGGKSTRQIKLAKQSATRMMFGAMKQLPLSPRTASGNCKDDFWVDGLARDPVAHVKTMQVRLVRRI